MQVKVCSFAPGQNLQPIQQLIHHEHIAFSLQEDEFGIHLYVDDSDITKVSALLNRVARPAVPQSSAHAAWPTISRSPLTFIAAILGVLGFAIAYFDSQLILVRWLTFTPLTVWGDHVQFTPASTTYFQQHEWWRLLTPTFLHFGIAHILFNGLAMWEVGRRIEYCLKPVWFLIFFLIMAVSADVVQYVWFGPGIFGGLSGVLYGFFGMQPVLYYRTKHRLLAMPKGVYIVLVVSLLLGPLGIMEKVFGVHIADGAHFGGLLCGLILAAIMPLSAMKVEVSNIR